MWLQAKKINWFGNSLKIIKKSVYKWFMVYYIILYILYTYKVSVYICRESVNQLNYENSVFVVQ